MRLKTVCGSVSAVIATGVLSGCMSANPEITQAVFKPSDPAISFNDTRWDGVAIPETGVGKQCGASDPYFPSLRVDLDKLSSVFKSGVVGLEVDVYDRDNPTYHGGWSYVVPEGGVFETPAVPSESMKLPDTVKGLRQHSWTGTAAGFYLAPSSCVVGGGHVYYSQLSFNLANGEKIRLKLNLGRQK